MSFKQAFALLYEIYIREAIYSDLQANVAPLHKSCL
jgi:hypothetical protein